MRAYFEQKNLAVERAAQSPSENCPQAGPSMGSDIVSEEEKEEEEGERTSRLAIDKELAH